MYMYVHNVNLINPPAMCPVIDIIHGTGLETQSVRVTGGGRGFAIARYLKLEVKQQKQPSLYLILQRILTNVVAQECQVVGLTQGREKR